MKVTKHTRAGANGKIIVCPCSYKSKVYHFAWISCVCRNCKKEVNKYDYDLLPVTFDVLNDSEFLAQFNNCAEYHTN